MPRITCGMACSHRSSVSKVCHTVTSTYTCQASAKQQIFHMTVMLYTYDLHMTYQGYLTVFKGLEFGHSLLSNRYLCKEGLWQFAQVLVEVQSSHIAQTFQHLHVACPLHPCLLYPSGPRTVIIVSSLSLNKVPDAPSSRPQQVATHALVGSVHVTRNNLPAWY